MLVPARGKPITVSAAKTHLWWAHSTPDLAQNGEWSAIVSERESAVQFEGAWVPAKPSTRRGMLALKQANLPALRAEFRSNLSRNAEDEFDC